MSIGMPIYNEARFLEATLESLVSQTFTDLEIVISDNGSTDGTEAICRAFAARDARIRYDRLDHNVGAIHNFNRAFELARGEFFMWSSGHDIRAPTYVAECVAVLEADPGVVLCHTHVEVVDAAGAHVETIEDAFETRGLAPFERARRAITTLVDLPFLDPVYGLIRAEAMDWRPVARNRWGPDHLILLELSLRGSTAQIPRPLYVRRVSRDPKVRREHQIEDYFERLDPANRDRRSKFSHGGLVVDDARMLMRSSFTLRERLALAATATRAILARHWWQILFYDALFGTVRLLLGDRLTRELKAPVYRALRRVRHAATRV